MRGLSEANGSWKIIRISRRNARSSRSATCARSWTRQGVPDVRFAG
jgi:hypothetical protein